MKKTKNIKIGILGFGNVGKGIVTNINSGNFPDMEIAGIFTRRDPNEINTENLPVYHISEIAKFVDKIDIMMLCGGSATDLISQGPQAAKMFNTIDSYDTHARIPQYYEMMQEATRQSGKLATISVGWDPGLFSQIRNMSEAVIPVGKTYVFWGPGVSQGHSDAIRRVEGVKDATQYTIPKKDAIDAVRSGNNPNLTTRDMHLRECYVVAKENANLPQIEKNIKEMPNYFADYDTNVHFISQEELNENHKKLPHGGFVIRSGETSEGVKQTMEFSLNLTSNAEFTSSVLLAYARGAVKMKKMGESGVISIFDIPTSLISTRSSENQREKLL